MLRSMTPSIAVALWWGGLQAIVLIVDVGLVVRSTLLRVILYRRRSILGGRGCTAVA